MWRQGADGPVLRSISPVLLLTNRSIWISLGQPGASAPGVLATAYPSQLVQEDFEKLVFKVGLLVGGSDGGFLGGVALDELLDIGVIDVVCLGEGAGQLPSSTLTD